MIKTKTFYRVVGLLIIIVLAFIVYMIFSPENSLTYKIEERDRLNPADSQVLSYKSSQVLEIRETDRVLGSDNASLKIFVYEDYSNPYSADLADTLEKIKRDYKNEVAIIVRPFALKSDVMSKQTALAMYCSGNKWEKMRIALFNAVKDESLMSNALVPLADSVRLSENKFVECLNDLAREEDLNNIDRELKAYSVLGAPTIFIEDEIILGARPYNDYVDSNDDQIEGLKTVIDRMLK